MATASQNNLSLVIQQQDINGTNILNRLVGAIAYAGIVGQFTDGQVGTVQTTLVLPTTNLLQFYFKNTSSAANITIVATPQGGASATIVDVGPGDVFVNWC